MHLCFISSQVGTVVFGYLLAVCFKWSPQTEQYLRTLALPVWAVLLFYIGECGQRPQPAIQAASLDCRRFLLDVVNKLLPVQIHLSLKQRARRVR